VLADQIVAVVWRFSGGGLCGVLKGWCMTFPGPQLRYEGVDVLENSQDAVAMMLSRGRIPGLKSRYI